MQESIPLLASLSRAGWRVGSPVPRWENLTPVHGNIFAWAEAAGGGAQRVVAVPNSGSFLTMELENWEHVLLLLLAMCPSAREGPLMDRVSPLRHIFNPLCIS